MAERANGKKMRTHERIVAQAAKLFRERGIAGASVDDVMAAADLTRGGFYAHFADKSALVAESLDLAFAEARRALFDSETIPGRAWVAATVSHYTDPDHLDNSDRCPVPALAADVARGDAGVRAVFTKNIRVNIELAEKLSGAKGRHARAYTIKMLSAWVGAVILARAVDDRSLAVEILESARKDALREYDERIEPHARPKGGIGHGLEKEPHARPKGGIGHARSVDARPKATDQRVQRKSRKTGSAQKRNGENQNSAESPALRQLPIK